MKHICLVRKMTGITQKSLALYLGISRSLLALHEAGRRNLPVEASAKMTNLEIILAKQETAKSKISNKRMQPETAARHKQLSLKFANIAKKQSIDVQLMKMKLTIMQEEHSRNQVLINLLNASFASVAHLKESDYERLCWNSLNNVALKTLAATDEAAQFELKWKIAELKRYK
ncbi:MAG: hypothetical protein ABIY51_15655 [Ferruginibacter sp.]